MYYCLLTLSVLYITTHENIKRGYCIVYLYKEVKDNIIP